MGIGEILLILVIALIIFGPGKIPEIARTLGRTVRAFRKATSDLTTAVTKELNTEEKPSQPHLRYTSNEDAKESSDTNKANPTEEALANQKDM